MENLNSLKNLNEKQKEAVLHTEGPLLVMAGAGAGKTKTITERILHLIKKGVAPHEILAVTFTNKAASNMKEQVEKLLLKDREINSPISSFERPYVSTFHSLGVQIIKENSAKLNRPRHFTIFDRSDSLSVIRSAVKDLGLDPKQFEPNKFLSIISKQKGEGISLRDYETKATDNYLDRILLSVWQKYEKALNEEKAYDFDDLLLISQNLLERDREVLETYQKRWRYIHIDEYQDTNKVQYKIAKLLADKYKNICVVGDVDQCLVAGTKVTLGNGSTKLIEKIKVGDTVLSNYGSGDYRGAKVEKTFSRNSFEELIRVTFESGEKITSSPHHTHFAGYRLGIAPQYYFTYLLWKKGKGYRLGTSQVYTKGQKKSVVGVLQRARQEHADALWIIKAHSTPNEARVTEYLLSLEYKIPTLPFVARKGVSVSGYVHDQKIIDDIFAHFNTEVGAPNLLKSLGLSPDHPHHRAQSRNSNRHNLTITLCGDRRGKTPMHRISMLGNDLQGKEKLRELGLSVRTAKSGTSCWRFETVNSDYAKLMEIAKTVSESFPSLNIILNARMGKQADFIGNNSLPFLPAASVLPGMAMFSKDGGYGVVKKVERLPGKKVRLYDLDIEHTHNFIANGILTHNSIYSWRGADFKNLMRFEKDYPGAKTILLEENYRSTKTILKAANDVIKKNVFRVEKNLFTENPEGEKITLYGAYDESGEAQYIANKTKELISKGVSPSNIALLYRANFQSRILEEVFLTENIPHQVLGVRFFERKEVKDTLSYLRAALNTEGTTDIKRIINTPTRGIGKTTILKLFGGRESDLPDATKKKISDFRIILAHIKEKAAALKLSETILFIIKESGLEKSFKESGDDGEERLLNVFELVSVAQKYDFMEPLEGVERFLTDAALASDQDDLKEEKKGVRLMTVHASKGLEFDYVFVTGLEEDLFPHARPDSSKKNMEEKEEERRLFYVALTRAGKKLYLTYANIRTVFGNRSLNMPSSFLDDIAPEILESEFLDDDTTRGKIIYLE